MSFGRQQNKALKDSIIKMRMAVLLRILESRDAKVLPIEIKLNILMGKNNLQIIRAIISRQSVLFKLRELYKRLQDLVFNSS